MDAKTIGVVALKGGVGKTSVVANLGACLARDFNKKVLLVDANFSTPHLGLHFGIINPKKALQHSLNNQIDIREAIIEHPIGFHIIPGMLFPFSINPLVLKEKLQSIKKEYDIILLDSSPSLNDELYATMDSSDEILVVSTPDYPTLSSTLHAIKLAQKKNSPIRGIVLNKIRGKKFELTAREIAKVSEIEILAALPDDVNVLAALAQMTPVSEYKPNKEVSKKFRNLSATLIGENYKRSLFSKAKDIYKKLRKTEGGKK